MPRVNRCYKLKTVDTRARHLTPSKYHRKWWCGDLSF